MALLNQLATFNQTKIDGVALGQRKRLAHHHVLGEVFKCVRPLRHA